jgi:hypothetical protein
MYASIAVGLASIRTWKWLNADALAALAVAGKGMHQTPLLQTDATNHAACDDGHAAAASAELAAPLRHAWLKALHGALFIYAFVMLLGAGQAFLGNARVHGFPYANLPGDATVVDSLHARCYGRDLRDSSAPAWLTALPCDLGEVCAASVNGGANKYNPL